MAGVGKTIGPEKLVYGAKNFASMYFVQKCDVHLV